MALLFACTVMAYLLNYELFHLAYHVPDDHAVLRVPGLRRLRRLHQTHHDPEGMLRWNFNITYPLTDWLMGTWRR